VDPGDLGIVYEDGKMGDTPSVLVNNRRLRYFLAAVEGVGAAAGLYRVGVVALSGSITGASWPVLLFFGVLYAIGIFTAAKTVVGSLDMVDLSLVFWGAQIPSIVTNVVGYRMFCGIGVYISAALDVPRLFFVTQVGSDFIFYLGHAGLQPRIGINLVGVVVFALFLFSRHAMSRRR